MKECATLGEERLELPVLHEGHHEEEESDSNQEQAREGVGGQDQKLVVRRGPEQLLSHPDPVPDGVNFLHVEHHQDPTRHGEQAMQEADQEEG